ncbi:MAG: sugar ABC transporter permease [Trueperaceae bacterium]|nr:MAG: sugar ABC transporter permease [Trueperaceae bacterium]
MYKRYKWIVPATFLFLPVTVYLAFVIIPTLNSLFYSFTDWAGYGADFDLIWLDNFARIFTDRLFSNAIKNTATWLALAMSVPTLAGLCLALALQGKNAVNTAYKSLFYLPIALSPIIVGIIWVWIYSPQLGIVNLTLKAIGQEHLARAWLANPDTALIAVFVAWAWQQTGLNMVIFLAGLTSVPVPLVEAARVDGANYWQTLRRVTIPMLRPATVVVMALTAINALKSFEVIWVMTKGGPFNSSDTLAVFMYSESFRKYKMGYGSSIAVVLFLMTLIIIVLYFRQTAAAEELYD